MVNCPKCGFNQPPDQFCANCGVDMIRFENLHASAFSWSKLLASTLFQAFVILIIVVATSVTIYRKKHAEMERIIAQNLASSSPAQPTAPAQPSEPVASPPTHQEPPSQTQAAPAQAQLANGQPTSSLAAKAPNAATTAEATNSPVLAAASSSSAGPSSSTPPTPSLRIFAAQAPIALINRLSGVHQLSGQGTVNAGVVGSLSSQLQSARDAQELTVLEDSEKQVVQIGKAQEFNKMATDAGNNTSQGFEFKISPQMMDVHGLHLNFVLTRTARETSTPPTARPTQLSYRESAVLTNGAGVYVYGFWPHRGAFLGEEKSLPDIILQLMAKPDFINSTDELVLFIEGSGLPEGSPSGRY